MTAKELSLINRLELNIYKRLGVPYFKRAILWLEKKKHRKDKQKNENYHTGALSVFSLEKYVGYTIYNSLLHCASLLLVFVYFGLTCVFGIRIMAFDIIISVLLMLNIYCIMLQRFNQLRIRDSCNKYYMRKNNIIIKNLKLLSEKIAAYKSDEVNADYNLVCRIKNCLIENVDCIVTNDDIASLKRLVKCSDGLMPKHQVKRHRNPSQSSFLLACKAVPKLYTVMQRRVDWIQKVLGKTAGRRMLKNIVIVTEDAEIDFLFQKLFWEDSFECALLVCGLLYEGYKNKVDGKMAYETQ